MLKNKNSKGILFDLDGVLYVGNKIIRGADETIYKLRKSGYVLRFLTNTTTSTTTKLHDKLSKFGIECKVSELISPFSVAVHKLNEFGFKSIYPVLRKEVMSEFKSFYTQETNPDCIIIGDIGNEWNYELMNKLFNLVMNGSQIISLHKGKYFLTEEGLMIDIGAFVTGLEYATGKSSINCGKPEKDFFETAIRSMNLPKDEIVMIGDDIDNDIGGAKSVGLKAYLVRTGKYNEEFLKRSEIIPDKIIESVNSLIN